MTLKRYRIAAIMSVALASIVLTACERVSVAVHHQDHPHRHEHVWAFYDCPDCVGDCYFCHGCDRYRHAGGSVRVDVRVQHEHDWDRKYCRGCGDVCRYCDDCRSWRHVKVRTTRERPRHVHQWTAKYCKQHRQECMVCTGCKRVRHEQAPPPPKPRTHKGRAGG